MPPLPPEAALWTSLAAIAAALVTGFFTLRNGRAATAPSNSQANLAWVKQAHDEATEAKAEARQAKADAAGAEEQVRSMRRQADEYERDRTRAVDEYERRLIALDALTVELMGWISRVLTRAQEVDAAEPLDPKVGDLLRVINGGPPSMSTANMRRDRS